MKLKKFAKKLGISQSRLSQWLSGKRRPDSWEMVEQAAATAGLPFERLARMLKDDPASFRAAIKALSD